MTTFTYDTDDTDRKPVAAIDSLGILCFPIDPEFGKEDFKENTGHIWMPLGGHGVATNEQDWELVLKKAKKVFYLGDKLTITF